MAYQLHTRGNYRIVPKSPEKRMLPYQRRWILDDSLLKLMEKSRQTGISWATAYALVRRQAKSKAASGSGYDAWVSSRDEIQARLFLEDCKSFAKILDIGARDLGEMVIDSESKTTAFVQHFESGKRIHSMSSNPDGQAGKRGDRCLDEFGLHKDNRKLYSIAEPGLTWGGQMEIISTHRGNLNFFNELVREVKEGDNPKGISLHTVTLEDALNEGFLYKLQEKLPKTHPVLELDEQGYFDYIKSRAADEETFMQEYMCVPADDATAFLEWDLIASAEYAPNEEWETDLSQVSGPLYLGVDVGRRHDLTVMWVLEYYSGFWFTRKVIELRNAKFARQREVLYDLINQPKMRRTCIDATGLGMQLAEEAQDKFGEYRVEAVTFTPSVKEELAYPVRGLMEDRTLKIPHSREIRQDLRGVKKEYTTSGNIRFSADVGPDGHSDRFWALGLAVHGGKRPTVVKSSTPRRESREHRFNRGREGFLA